MQLQQFENMDERIFYDQHQLFIHQLHCITTIDKLQDAWQPLHNKQKIILQYAKSKECVFADFLLNNMQGKKEDAQVLQFLFDNGFTFNKQDIRKLKHNNWLEYRSYDAGQVYEVNILMPFKKAVHKLGKMVGYKPRPALYIVQFFSIDMLKVLFQYIDKLPKKLKSKVLRDMPDSELKNHQNSTFNFL